MILKILFLLVIPAYLFPSTVEITNEFIKIITDSDTGRYIIKTTGGDPKLTTDQNALLLYNSNPPNSFTTVKIDNEDYSFGDKNGKFIQPPIKKDENIICAWKIKNIIIIQKLMFIVEPTTGNKDSVEIAYKIQNNDYQNHTVGIRIMLDTFLGGEDGAPFRIPELGPVMTEKEFESISIPQYWYSYDDLIKPNVQAQGTLIIKKSRPPDKVMFACCMRFMQHSWDFPIMKERDFKRSNIDAMDSAAAIFWNPETIKPKENFIVKTYYGLYGASIQKGDIFNVALSSPVKISGEPFIINTDMQNTSPFRADNVIAKIMLPKGLKLFENETAEKNIGSLEPKEMIRASWNVIPDETVADEVNYKVNIAAKIKEEDTHVMPDMIPERKIIITEKKEIIETNINKNKELNIEAIEISNIISLTTPPLKDKIIKPVKRAVEKTNKEILKKNVLPAPDKQEITKPDNTIPDKPAVKIPDIRKPEKHITNKSFSLIPKKEEKPSDEAKIDNTVDLKLDTILFNFDLTELTDKAKTTLDKIGNLIKEYKVKYLIIKGYTCNIGYRYYNLRLSEERAKKTASYLIEKGYITESQYIWKRFGWDYPIADNSTEEGRQENRRVEIFLIGEKK